MTLPGPSHRAHHRSADRRARILVVDGEERMRVALARLLEHAGHGVVTCSGLDAALALLAADGGFSLVVTAATVADGLDGLVLARWVADELPGLGVIVLAGDEDPVEATRIASVVATVPRTEAVRGLLGSVRSTLGA